MGEAQPRLSHHHR